MIKYIFVTGGVMSGIGKGILTASIGKILQVRGLKVTAVKIDPYLNVDAGTMNPIMHGEVFVTEDGGEIDMDLGTYERFLDKNLTKDHNITTGQVYQSVIKKERHGIYLGKCVQIIPHITDEIKDRIRNTVKNEKVDVVVTEIGGTVGDIESLPFLEAARQIRLEEKPHTVLYAHVTVVPILNVVGEQKTKPTQHSVQELRRIGIQPDIIIARSIEILKPDPKKKIALFCNVEEKAVFTSPDLKCLYESPLILDRQGMGNYICENLFLPKKKAKWDRWEKMVERFQKPKKIVQIAVCGKYADLADSYVSINEALKHAGASSGARVKIDWIETEQFEESTDNLNNLLEYDGILIPGGFGSRGTEGKIKAIEYARKMDIPFLGICFGFQLAVVEYARHLGFEDAHSTEINPDSRNPVICIMPEQKSVSDLGATMRLGGHKIVIDSNTLAHRLYKGQEIIERHRHRYEVTPPYIEKLISGGLVFSGRSPDDKRMEMLEIPSHKFFLATQFHGEFKSRPDKPSPPYYGFIKASLENKNMKKSLS